MRYIEDEILKRKLRAGKQESDEEEEQTKEQGKLTWKVRHDSVTWKEFVLEQVISFLLDSGGDVGLSTEEIAGEINVPAIEVKPFITQLLEEGFIVQQEHWLMDETGKEWYILNRKQPNVGEEEKTREVTFALTPAAE